MRLLIPKSRPVRCLRITYELGALTEYDLVEFLPIAVILTIACLNQKLVGVQFQHFILSATTLLVSADPKPFKAQ